MTQGKMDMRDPNPFDMLMQGNEGIGDQIRAIYSKYKSQIKIFETEIQYEAPDADAEILLDYTDTFSGAARNVDTVVCTADVAKSLNSTAFYFCVTSTQHYVWLDVDNTGSDPSLTGTAHEVDISENDNAATVGGAIQAVIDALANITCAGTSTLTISNDNVGVNTIPATDEDTGFTFTNVIAGAAAYTASYFYAVSSDAKDTAAGVGARTIRVGIIDANGYPTTTDISLAGATAVISSVKAKAIYGAWVLTAGSEHDPAGTITLLDNGANDVYCTIAAGELSSISARCWVPASWNAVIGDVRGYPIYSNHADADVDEEQGAILTPSFNSEPNGLADDELDKCIITNYYPFYRNDRHDICDGGNGAYITFNQATKADDKNLTYYCKIRYILWSD